MELIFQQTKRRPELLEKIGLQFNECAEMPFHWGNLCSRKVNLSLTTRTIQQPLTGEEINIVRRSCGDG